MEEIYATEWELGQVDEALFARVGRHVTERLAHQVHFAPKSGHVIYCTVIICTVHEDRVVVRRVPE